MAKEIRYILVGLGNIGRNLLDILMHRQKNIEAQYDLTFKLVAAVDSAVAVAVVSAVVVVVSVVVAVVAVAVSEVKIIQFY